MTEDRARCAVTAALLEQGRGIDRLSWLLTAAALLGLLLGRGWPMLPVLAAGLAEGFLAARVGFDAALFRELGRGTLPGPAAMDGALLELGLIPAAKAGRPLAPRMAGARRLLRWQALAAAAQLALLLGAVALPG
jgi:hypothetical protein